MRAGAPGSQPSTSLVVLAFAIVYVVWGSTYLGIRFAVETIPPFTMAAARFLSAGAVLFGWARLRRAPRPTGRHWKSALVVGWLLMGTNGLLSWAEQYVPSGVAALLVATVPMWMVGLDTVRPGGRRPSPPVLAGLVLGTVGVAVLVGGGTESGAALSPFHAAVLLVAAFGWALGSVYSRYADQTESTLQNVGMQMLLGGALLLAIGLMTGERVDVAAVSARSFWSLVYLASAGGLVAYAAYLWLLQVSTPARVATYAYVNPVVAVLLGWALAGESLTARIGLAAALVVAAVVLITTKRSTRRDHATPSESDSAPTRGEPSSGARER